MDGTRPNALVRVQPARDFDGHGLVAVELNGRQHWAANQIASSLGYGDAHRIASKVAGDWSADLELGTDYVVLAGDELAALKSVAPGIVDKFAPSLMLLTDSGVHLVAMLTRQPAGKRLRRWLADEVLPALRRDGFYTKASAEGDVSRRTVADRLRRLEVELLGADHPWRRRLLVRIAEIETGEDLGDVLADLVVVSPALRLARRAPGGGVIPKLGVPGRDLPRAPHDDAGAQLVASGSGWTPDLIALDLAWFDENVAAWNQAAHLPPGQRPGLRCLPTLRRLAQRWNLRRPDGGFDEVLAHLHLCRFYGVDARLGGTSLRPGGGR